VAWSTRQLAELTGTTVNTIRHYHRLGLLEEPERRNNGYKRYGTPELVRLLRIRRLVELGVPLARIGAAGPDGLDPEALRQVDAELAAAIGRMVRSRSDIAAILSAGAPADTPAGFEAVASQLSTADRSLIHVYIQLYDEKRVADLRRMVEAAAGPISADINALTSDSDEATRENLAEKFAPILTRHLIDCPWLSDPAARPQQTFLEAVAGLYNSAQLDVLGRAAVLAQEQLNV